MCGGARRPCARSHRRGLHEATRLRWLRRTVPHRASRRIRRRHGCTAPAARQAFPRRRRRRPRGHSRPRSPLVWRSNFNIQEWKPALAAAGLIPQPEDGEPHASAREHGMHALRHFYASVLLDAGESIKAVSQFLGHSDPALTLRVYAHLMPSSQKRTREAVDAALAN
ncbi:tyrosine-type recombinase/integrase [Streptomyces sp. NPDC056543]|uniref:tyrosine-type recombinase/integrase n=1 Tax=unclassified Streptomyces TaxID=2593676 RepID=UPI0036978364